jgi:hypothetical protein
MKKIIVLLATLIMAMSGFAQSYVMKSAQPNSSNIAIFTNTTDHVWTPVIIYTELAGSLATNVATLTYSPYTITETAARLFTNAVDNGKSYRIGTSTQVVSNETTAVMNTPQDSSNNVGYTVLKRKDKLTFTGNGGVTYSNVYYRILFKEE